MAHSGALLNDTQKDAQHKSKKVQSDDLTMSFKFLNPTEKAAIDALLGHMRAFWLMIKLPKMLQHARINVWSLGTCPVVASAHTRFATPGGDGSVAAIVF